MDLPKAVQGISEPVQWSEITGLDFCNEEWSKYFTFSLDNPTMLTYSVNCVSVDFIFISEFNIGQ